MSEKNNGYRSWIRKDGFYAISEEYVKEYGQLYNTWNSGYIFKGQWISYGMKDLEKEDLHIDYSIRGILNPNNSKALRRAAKIALFKTPITTSKSFFNIAGLYIKSLFSKLE